MTRCPDCGATPWLYPCLEQHCPIERPSPDDFRMVPCEGCQSEGRIIRDRAAPYWADEPQEIDYGPCAECEGTGMAVIEVEPVEEEEIMR